MLPIWLTDSVTPDLDRALHYTTLWGLEGLELRTVGRHRERVPGVNEARLRRRLAEYEMPVEAIDPGLFAGDAAHRSEWLDELSTFPDTLAFCRRIGCPRIVIAAFTDASDAARADALTALRRAADAAGREGVTLAVGHEPASYAPTPAALADVLAEIDHPALRAAWDPAAALQQGCRPLDDLPVLAPRLGFVRCTDGMVAEGGWAPAPFGEGAVGWEALVAGLAAEGYDGPLSLAVTVEPRPKEGLRAATRLHHLIRSGRSAASSLPVS